MNKSNKYLWLHNNASRKSTITQLPVPFMHSDEIIDSQLLRDWALGKSRDQRPPAYPSTGIRTVRSIGERIENGQLSTERHLKFVISGVLEVTAGDGSVVLLTPGDILLSDDDLGEGCSIRYEGDCRVIELLVDSWKPEEIMPTPDPVWPSPPPSREPMLQRMYSGADGRSYFSTFTELFDNGSARPTPWVPTTGFYFCSMGDPFFLDWHPEDDNILVIVLSGEMELYTDSCGGVCRNFGPGDVCLAEDLVGKGHIDYMRGGVKLACVRIERKHLWPSSYLGAVLDPPWMQWRPLSEG